MRHALIYYGGFERNFGKLTPDSTTFEGTDGAVHEAPAWPASADGLRITYMEKAGKKFCVVRVGDSQSSVVLANDLVLEPGRHYGYHVRLSGEPTLVEDDSTVLVMLEDIIKKNHDGPGNLLTMRARLKAATHKPQG